MHVELQGWDVARGHGGCTGTQGPLRLTPKIGSEEKLGRWLSTVCPVSAAIRLATWLPQPGDRDLSDTRRSAAGTAGPPELRQRPRVQLTGRCRRTLRADSRHRAVSGPARRGPPGRRTWLSPRW